MPPLARRVVVLAGLAVLAGCASVGAPAVPQDGGAAQDGGTPRDGGGADGGGAVDGGGTDGGGAVDGGGTDGGGAEDGGADGGGGDAGVIKQPTGSACSEPSDCIYAYCIPSDDPTSGTGKVCSNACYLGCPADWACGRVSLGTSTVQVCRPAVDLFCKPCTQQRTCTSSTTGRCAAIADGTYCFAPCATPCPTGFACGTSDGGVTACLPVSEHCGPCTSHTCDELGIQCGDTDDGCGNTITCPDCPSGVCHLGSCCEPKTCADFPGRCGVFDDTCGSTVSCGCGGADVCTAQGSCCTPQSCVARGYTCGTVDNCGTPLDCNTVPCDGGVCAEGHCCTPATCASLGKQCGTWPDGCGGQVVCTCANPGDSCTPTGSCCTAIDPCQDGGCGTFTDNCGNSRTCLGCAAPFVCGADGGCVCPPLKTCTDYPNQCGSLSNGCTGTISCSCGDGGVCDAGTCCQKKTCADYGGQCGTLSDGCGATISCACGDGGTCDAGLCCQRKNCAQLGKSCGTWSDECGGQVSCGGCDGGTQCNGGTCTSCADGGNPCGGGFCGQTTDGCGNPVTCSCPNDPHYACVGNLCTCTPDSCGTPGRECGFFADNGCGQSLDCPSTCPVDGGSACDDQNCRNYACSFGECVCTPDSCPSGANLCGDGCGNFVPCSCGNDVLYDRCNAGSCTCAVDAWEPNDTVARSFVDPTKAVTDPANTFTASANRCATIEPNMPSANRDWFALRVVEASTSKDPYVRARLTGIPAGANYDLFAAWRCDVGQPANCRSNNFNVVCPNGTSPYFIDFQGAGDLCACGSTQAGNAEELIANMQLRCGASARTGVLFLLVNPVTTTSPLTCTRYSLGVKVSESAISTSCP